MSRVFLILYQETLGEYTSEHGAAVGAYTPEEALATLRGSYGATIIRLTIRSVVEWQPDLSTKVVARSPTAQVGPIGGVIFE